MSSVYAEYCKQCQLHHHPMCSCDIKDRIETCPFCKDTSFDLKGLKYHLEYKCVEYDEMESLE